MEKFRIIWPDYICNDHNLKSPIECYHATDIDALLTDVRRLMDAAKNIDSGNLVDDVFYRALDSIYQRGWHDQFHNRPYDARGNKEWQFAFNLMHKIKQAIAAVERHFESNKNTQIKGIDNQK